MTRNVLKTLGLLRASFAAAIPLLIATSAFAQTQPRPRPAVRPQRPAVKPRPNA